MLTVPVRGTEVSDTKITTLKNGPLLVSGNVELVDSDGKPIATQGTQFALCRCGASTKKPFCDGTHSKIGFEAAEAVVPESKE
jgi:CDGSH-type Zn-finger protein